MVVWQLKKISCLNRLRLWTKSNSLYICLLGFTDLERPEKQLRAAMICAFLSAVYDYNTDWVKSDSPETSEFVMLLNRWVENCQAARKAAKLFYADWNGELSENALERGSGAFRFYCSVIGSEWLSEYSAEELDEFGIFLQKVDDLLDLKHDVQHGDANCFLLKDCHRYVYEAMEAMTSEFFERLVQHSAVYTLIRWRCQHVCHKLCNALPTLNQIINAHRPMTALYAGGAVFAGFKMAGSVSWLSVVALAAFALITGNIMVFNDLVERKHDLLKNKGFCFKYTWSVIRAFVICSTAIVALVVAMAFADITLSLFAIGVWLVGLAYSCSFVRKLYVLQNVIVAACSATPILCGAIHSRVFFSSVLLVFATLTGLVLIREFLKDIDDVISDAGYKETIPTRKGVFATIFVVIMMVYLPAFFLATSPIKSLHLVGYSLGIVEWLASWSLLHNERYCYIKRGVDLVLFLLLITILIVV